MLAFVCQFDFKLIFILFSCSLCSASWTSWFLPLDLRFSFNWIFICWSCLVFFDMCCNVFLDAAPLRFAVEWRKVEPANPKMPMQFAMRKYEKIKQPVQSAPQKLTKIMMVLVGLIWMMIDTPPSACAHLILQCATIKESCYIMVMARVMTVMITMPHDDNLYNKKRCL